MFEDSVCRHAKAKAVLDDRVHRLRIGDAFGYDVGSFSQQRHLQPVAKLSRAVLPDDHRCLPAGRQQVPDSFGDGVRCLVSFHDLDQRHQVRRIPEVGRHYPFGMRASRGDRRDAQPRSVGRQHRLRPRQPVHACKQFLLPLPFSPVRTRPPGRTRRWFRRMRPIRSPALLPALLPPCDARPAAASTCSSSRAFSSPCAAPVPGTAQDGRAHAP